MKALQTKVELLQGDIVSFTSKHKDVETNSLKIAKNLDVQHSDVTRIIKRLIKSGAISQSTIAVSDYLNDRGKVYKYYLLKEVEALQVVMSLSGAKAEKLHKEIAQAFVSMKDENTKWREQSLLTTSTTIQANDEIHQLQNDLAEAMPLSRKSRFLFIHIQKAITKATTGSRDTKREMMTSCQLHEVEQLEQQVQVDIVRLRTGGIAPEQIRINVLDMIKAAPIFLKGALDNAT